MVIVSITRYLCPSLSNVSQNSDYEDEDESIDEKQAKQPFDQQTHQQPHVDPGCKPHVSPAHEHKHMLTLALEIVNSTLGKNCLTGSRSIQSVGIAAPVAC